MAITKAFLEEPPEGALRAQLTYVLTNVDGFTDMNERTRYVKAILGLVQEICYNRDDRMGFVEHSKYLSIYLTTVLLFFLACQQMTFLQVMIGLV